MMGGPRHQHLHQEWQEPLEEPGPVFVASGGVNSTALRDPRGGRSVICSVYIYTILTPWLLIELPPRKSLRKAVVQDEDEDDDHAASAPGLAVRCPLLSVRDCRRVGARSTRKRKKVSKVWGRSS